MQWNKTVIYCGTQLKMLIPNSQKIGAYLPNDLQFLSGAMPIVFIFGGNVTQNENWKSDFTQLIKFWGVKYPIA